MTIIKFSSSDDDSSDSWVSIADMMAGLMMIFLLLAVWHVASNISSDTDIEPPPVNGGEGGPTGAGGTGVDVPLIDPVKKWRDLEDAIYRALVEEFEPVSYTHL
ncbi:MAG: hypothetical protein MPK62_14480, partial [Alphaproteobacteria bacterium]|nr:hypothetical protein [Alphaproteobacteria bacterium]